MRDFYKNYVKIYFWRINSILSGFLSMLIVVPHLSNDPELYGIYSFCIAFTLYLTYADIGFLNAGQKYAAEAYARNNRKEEVEIFGFTAAILLLMIIPFSVVMIYLSYNPDLLISDLSEKGRDVIGSIFLILGTVLPFQITIQRLVQSILIIRIKDYISLRVDVIFNLVKIGSVFYFFTGDTYLVVEYYLFITLTTILSSVIILMTIKKTENYDFLLLLKSIKLRKKEYSLINKLAYSSLVLSLGWLIYYELDVILIGKYFGPNDIAIYAIGFTFLSFLRTLWGSVFSPFSQRFNHLVVLNSDLELKKLIKIIIDYTLPLCILVTLTLVLAAEKMTYYWVGEYYKDSILILKILILGTVFNFVTHPASFYFNSATKYKFIYLIALILPITFFLGVILLFPNYGLLGIAISKSLAMCCGFFIYMIGISRIYKPMIAFKKWFINLSIMCLFISYVFPLILNNFFISQEKSTMNLVILLLISGVIIVLSYFLLLLTKQQQRKDLRAVLSYIYSRYRPTRNI